MTGILFISGTTRPGGAWESLRDIVFGLDRQEFEPAIASAKPPAWTGPKDGIKSVLVKMPMWRKGKSLLRIPFAVSRLSRVLRSLNISLIHANSLWDVPYAIWAARPFGIPVVAHIRTEITRDKVRKYSIDKADAVITTSRKSESMLTKFRRLDSKVCHLPNGVDLDRFDPSLPGDETRAKHRIAKDAIIYSAIGRIDKLKGLDLLVLAFSQLLKKAPNARLLIVGDNRGKGSSFKLELQEQIASFGLENHVVFPGQVTDVVPYYAATDVLVMPSRTEGFGRSAVEAMAMAKPVIASDVGGLPEVVRDRKTGYIFGDGNAEELAERMTTLALSRTMRVKFGAKGRDVAEKSFDLNSIVAAIQNIYRSQIAKREKA
ncbi:glycosyltransferase family 4 protein [bacterium]|nr:glycosyltransferase family 4 protein [bacterium]